MKENSCQLYPNEQVGEKVSQYALEHSLDIPNHILGHHAWANENHERSHMMISPLQTQYQIFMARALGAKRVLEIGCFIGFSAMGWSEAVGPDGHVTTLEFVPKYAKVAEETWAKNGIKNIEVIVGPAEESIKTLIKTLSAPYDLIFIDANKDGYPAYLNLILSLSQPSSTTTRLLKPNGLIIADNILRRGLVADSSDANPFASEEAMNAMGWVHGDTKFLDEFNKLMKEEDRIEALLLPLFDGLGMGRLMD